MTSPIRCLSSQLTTQLMLFRNPQGREENWIFGGERIERNCLSISLHVAKVITAEIGIALLCVSALVESAVYGILFIGSLPLLCCTHRPTDFFVNRVSSSGFTLLWNIGNLFVFNPFNTNAVTHESFARYSIDHWPRGLCFRVILAISLIAMSVFALGAHAPMPHNLSQLIDGNYTRLEDRQYIGEWEHERQLPHFLTLQDQNWWYTPHNRRTDNTNTQVGEKFLREHIFKAGEVKEETRQKILEQDPEIYHFVLTRTLYLYVFGICAETAIPNFLKSDTQKEIAKLRSVYGQHSERETIREDLAGHMSDLTVYENQQIQDCTLKTAFQQLQQAAYGELRESLFLTDCWQRAMVNHSRPNS